MGKDLLRESQKLRLHFKQIPEMVDDEVRRDEMPPGLVEKGVYAARFVAEELIQGKVDDAARLGESVAHLLEQFQR
jgi:hypothetical protein